MPTTITAYSGNSLRDAVRLILQDDATLTSLLTGGVFDASELPQGGMSMDDVPRATNGVDALPCAVIRFRDVPRFGPFPVHAGRGDIEIYVYQNLGYDVIDAAIVRIKALLLDAHIVVSDYDLAHVYWQHAGADMRDDELGELPMRFVRFTLTNV